MKQGAQCWRLERPQEVQSDAGVIEAYLGSIDDVSSLRRPQASQPAGRAA
jgi:branched-chain amino acid transport system ATP-binding protein